jgi:adenosylcobyric acid synthase
VEVNLQARDLTNLRLAQYLRAHCLLVADIERGGVFAQIVGTLALLTPVQRPLIKGILINRFRGRRELFDQGRSWLEQETGIPVLGVMPWLNELFPPEDSLDLLERRGRKTTAELEIAVLRLPSLSNFSDLDPLEAEASVQLRWIQPGEPLGRPDAVIVPGSKQTLRDLTALQASGLGPSLKDYAASGGQVFGICGGMQMLGHELMDPEGLEGGAGLASSAGLGLLPLRTVFGGAKALRQRRSQALWPLPSEGRSQGQDPVTVLGQQIQPALDLEGFELHRGVTTLNHAANLDPFANGGPLADDPSLGWWQAWGDQGGLVAGTYLHGVFESGPWRRRWLNQLRQHKGLPLLSERQPDHSRHRDQLLDRLADAFEEHVDLGPLLQS